MGKQDSNSAQKHAHKCACLLGESGGVPPPSPTENFEFRFSQIASDAIRDKIGCDKTVTTILNFKISGGGGGGNSMPV